MLKPGESEELTLAIDASNLDPGVYQQTLTIASDESVREVELSVEVTSQERAKLDVQPAEIETRGRAGERLEIEQTVTNEARPEGQPLEIDVQEASSFLELTSVRGEEVQAVGSGMRIDPQATATLIYEFEELVDEPRVFEGTVTLDSNDPEAVEENTPVRVRVRTPLISLETEWLVFSEEGSGVDSGLSG